MQIDNLDKYLSGVAIGVRFRPNFSFQDNLGSVIDTIIRAEDSLFNEVFFPRVDNSINSRVLHNDDYTQSLTLNQENIVLQYKLPELGDVNSLANVISEFKKRIMDEVLVKFNVTHYIRLGLIHFYTIEDKKISKDFINHLIDNTIEGVNEVGIQFSKKLPMIETIANGDVEDYRNIIYKVIKPADQDAIIISLDVQWYFNPFVEKSSHLKFKLFTEDAKEQSRKTIIRWLNEALGKAA